MSSKRLRKIELQFDAETMSGGVRDEDGGKDMGFDLPKLDTEHDPSGGALRAIILVWGAVVVMIVLLVLWLIT